MRTGALTNCFFVLDGAHADRARSIARQLLEQMRQDFDFAVTRITIHNHASGALESKGFREDEELTLPRHCDEIVIYDCADKRPGCLMLTREGHYLVSSVSTDRLVDGRPYLRETWRAIGSRLCAAAMGEEYEICEADIDVLVTQHAFPRDAQLCDAVIFKACPEQAHAHADLLAHNGIMLERACCTS